MDPFQLLPPLSAEEYAALKADIAARGVLVPVEVDEQGHVLDGHHRLRICQELGITPSDTKIRRGLTEDQKLAHILALNLARRHLTLEQRQELVVKLRAQGWSTTKIAETVRVDNKTVRNDLAGSDFSQPARVTGKDGKSYPAHRHTTIYAATPAQTAKALALLDTLPSAAVPEGELMTVRELQRAALRVEAAQRATNVVLPPVARTVHAPFTAIERQRNRTGEGAKWLGPVSVLRLQRPGRTGTRLLATRGPQSVPPVVQPLSGAARRRAAWRGTTER